MRQRKSLTQQVIETVIYVAISLIAMILLFYFVLAVYYPFMLR